MTGWSTSQSLTPAPWPAEGMDLAFTVTGRAREPAGVRLALCQPSARLSQTSSARHANVVFLVHTWGPRAVHSTAGFSLGWTRHSGAHPDGGRAGAARPPLALVDTELRSGLLSPGDLLHCTPASPFLNGHQSHESEGPASSRMASLEETVPSVALFPNAVAEGCGFEGHHPTQGWPQPKAPALFDLPLARVRSVLTPASWTRFFLFLLNAAKHGGKLLPAHHQPGPW